MKSQLFKNHLLTKIVNNNFYLASLITLLFILLTVSFGAYSNLSIPANPDPLAHYQGNPSSLSFLAEWDSPHYLQIASHGYAKNQDLTAFFPAYPLAIYLVSSLINNPLIAGLIISWLCLFGAIYFLIKIFQHFEIHNKTSQAGLLAMLSFLFYPTAIFYVAVYSESLMVFMGLASLYFSLKHRFLLASLFCLVASATHPDGLVFSLLVAMMAYEAHQKIKHIIGYLIISFSGLFGYMFYLSMTMHNALDFIKAQKGNSWLSSHYLSVIGKSITPLDLLILAVLAYSCYYFYKNGPKSFSVFSAIYFLLPFVGGNFAGFPRYSLMVLPLYILIYKKVVSKPLLYSLCLVISTLLWAYFVIRFSAGYTGGS